MLKKVFFDGTAVLQFSPEEAEAVILALKSIFHLYTPAGQWLINETIKEIETNVIHEVQ